MIIYLQQLHIRNGVGVIGSSEHGVEGLREDLAGASANVAEVSAVLVVPALLDARKGGGRVLNNDADDSGHELTVLLEVIEGGELLENSVEVREVAVAK